MYVIRRRIIDIAYKIYFIALIVLSIGIWVDEYFWVGLVCLLCGVILFFIQGALVSLITVAIRKLRSSLLGVYFVEPQQNPNIFEVILIVITLIITYVFCIRLISWIFGLN